MNCTFGYEIRNRLGSALLQSKSESRAGRFRVAVAKDFGSCEQEQIACLMIGIDGEKMKYKIPVSVLVVVYTPDLQVLLLERADKSGFWQSVTGSQEPGETLDETAIRELREETGLDAMQYRLENWNITHRFEIYKHWSSRYAPGTTRNTEHAFGLQVPNTIPVRISSREHLAYEWVPRDLAIDKVFSWTNAAVLQALPYYVTAAK